MPSNRHPDSVGKFKDLVPEGTKHYLRENLQFTDYAQQLILDLLKLGEHTYTACRIADVSPSTLTTWLRKGRSCTDETDAYYRFFIRYKDARLKGLHLLRKKQRERREDPQGFGDEPVTTHHNPIPLSLFTEENQRNILDLLRGGTFPAIAAEASGVPAPIFLYWIEEGKRDMIAGRSEGEFLGFYLSCMQIAAQARSGAEMRVYEDMPLAWLLHGPGRDRPDMPGWTKQSQITGADGGPVQVITEWKTAATTPQAIEIEGSVTEAIAAPTNDSTER